MLRSFPQDQKRRIVRTLDSETLIHGGYAGDMLGTDTKLAIDFMAEGVADGEVLLRSMLDYRDHTVAALPSALETALRNSDWTGDESNAIFSDFEFFAKLRMREQELDEVCALVGEEVGRQLEAARAPERRNDVAVVIKLSDSKFHPARAVPLHPLLVLRTLKTGKRPCAPVVGITVIIGGKNRPLDVRWGGDENGVWAPKNALSHGSWLRMSSVGTALRVRVMLMRNVRAVS